MGLIVQHDEIISLLKKLDIYNGDELIIYVTLKVSQPLYVRMNYLNLDNYIVQGAWLAINDNDIKILPVNQLGKLIDDVSVICQDDIDDFSIKKNLLLYTISIADLKGSVVQFRVSSKVLGNKKHHEDFLKLLNKMR
ncbi:hypothetical protein RV11_GL000584 [Enterococcus phoeniculicola]|jgi:hypothetical protein|uniref:YokE-like PH domain-containing protein n=1 Tax=Enterococcus phoeniculicola ATCC BAA-412 TaxID=1158610 RepID=R3W680_9ENTE|nr:hypothetical protein [Enterococcus phoeniculicola]EIB6117679.1 hypothetical protein [Enterococcus faecalis]EOL43201.1 hypothetical protein UC3_02178 [Enterococcus phoeniculicola ATCC BAA-412]EOT76441.1 hypothetical protein I589_01398 [Enterococcus phoeniculicola ATCC BAA-412]OJG71059.1 hypothetical protein RV11_GL000584 [Enterococcus phoeniculicola]